MIQKTRNLVLTLNLTPFGKVHDVDDCLAIWFSLVRLQLKIQKIVL